MAWSMGLFIGNVVSEMVTRQDGGGLDIYFYNRGFVDGKTGGPSAMPMSDPKTGAPATIDQQMSWEDGYNAGLYEYRQAHGGEPEGAGGGVG